MSEQTPFGNFVRERRREMGLTQEELARRVGCAAITLRKIEAEDLRASVQIAERLAMALAIPLDERAAFVRRARAVQPEGGEVPVVTPAPSLEEIGREDLTGRAIRGYALAERIGMGGMGSVYRAVQPNVEREVAVKIILPAFANHPEFIRRFEAEAQLVARLEHPHIVPLYDYWREPGVAYLVMRLLRGGNVQALLGGGPLPLETTAHMLEQICSALHAAHRTGVIHRDLKPANVLLDDDQNAYLADFGLAKNLGNPDLENASAVDAMIGSPQYMSPEQIQSLSVRPESDIYCLGVMLYEMLTGVLPFRGPTPFDLIQQHINTPMPPLAANHMGLPASIDAVVQRATAKDPQERYPDALALFADFRQAVAGALDLRPTAMSYEEEPADVDIANPFKGLRAFGEADADDFFGRETLVQQLLARLGEGGELNRFLAVIGPSGSGKSSAVRAGLVPALRRGGLPGSENWFIVDMLPGRHPFEELEAALLRVAVNPPEHLLSQLKDGPRGLLRAVQRVLPADESVELVLVVDQFEEVFTLVEDEAERALFLESLAAAVLDERSRLRVVITLRADFTDKPLRYVDFGELINRRFEFVLPLTPDEVERAVAGPAGRAGLKLEKGLVSTIIREAGDQPGTLPLLQHALADLVDNREGRMLTLKVYHEIGGVLGALGRSAEAIYAGLDEIGQSAARQVYLRLVTLGEGTEDTRRRVVRTEIENLALDHGPFLTPSPPTAHDQLSTVLDAFGRARLLTFDRDPLTRAATVEVAHEALLREWSRLRDWLNESRGDLRLQRQLAAAAGEWETEGRDPSFLFTGSRLGQFEGWAQNATIALTPDERAFLQASVAERDRRALEEQIRAQRELEAAQRLADEQSRRADEQAHSARRLRRRALLLAGALIAAVLLAGLAGFFGNRADQAASVSFSRELAGQAKLNLTVDPERSILLALAALDQSYSQEAENVLHEAVLASRLRRTLRGHDGPVYDLAYSPDGKMIATAGYDGTARLWDTATGQQVLTLSQPAGVGHLMFSPDGSRLATGAGDGIVRLWDVSSGKQLLTITAARQVLSSIPISVVYLAFTPDGKILATTANGESQVKFWDSESGEELFALSDPGWFGVAPGVDLLPNEIIFSPDGTRLAISLGSDGRVLGGIEIWDAVTREKLQTLAGRFESILPMSFSPDGTRLAAPRRGGLDDRGAVWDVSSGELLLNLRETGNDIHYSADGKRLLFAAGAGVVKVLDAETGDDLLVLVGHTGSIRRVAESPGCVKPPAATFEWCGQYIASASFDGTVRIWDISPAGSQEILTVPGSDFALSEDGTRLSTVVFPPNNPEGATVPIHQWALPIGLQPVQASSYTSSSIRVDAGYLFNWSSPDGIVVTYFLDRPPKFWDVLSGGEAVYSISCCAWTNDLFDWFSSRRNPRHVWGDLQTGKVTIWDLAKGELIETLQVAEPAELVWAYISPDGERLVTANLDSTVYTWDVTTGEKLLTLPGPATFDGGLWFSPDGKWLAIGDCSGTVVVRDIASGAEELRLSGSPGCTTGIAFSPDGKLLAVNIRTGMKIVDFETGQELLALPGGFKVEFTPDGTRVISASTDEQGREIVRMYLLELEELVALAKSRVTRSLTTEECRQYLHMDTCPAGP